LPRRTIVVARVALPPPATAPPSRGWSDLQPRAPPIQA
jgi:hypothetical protein